MYRWDGAVVPSVTQVLDIFHSFDHVDPMVLEAARNFGTHVHLATQLYDEGRLDEDALDPALVPYLNGWKKFLSESGFVITAIEEKVYHKRLRYAGTLDRRGLWRSSSWLLDIKSGAVPFTVGAQTAAYREAMDEKPKRRLCVQLMPNDYRISELKELSDFALFQSALNVFNYFRKHKRNPANVPVHA